VRDVIKITPPTGNAPWTESLNAQRKAGINATTNDIRKVFKSIRELEMVRAPRNPKLAAQIKKYARKDKIQELKTLLTRLGVKFRDVVAFAAPSRHLETRNSRGRTKGKPFLVTRADGRSIKELIAKKTALVGRAKAGWLVPAKALGVQVPQWISRHGGAPGQYVDELHIKGAPAIIVANLVKHAQASGRQLRIIQRALDRRAQSIVNRTNAMMGKLFEGYR
jgi:hypothetical protein